MNAHRKTCVITNQTDGTLARSTRAQQRCAHIKRIQRRQFFVMFVEDIGEAQQQRLAPGRLETAPRPFESLARRGDSAIDIDRVAIGHGRDHAPRSRIDRRERLPGGCAHMLTVDQ